jgi:alpha-1,6-mannosyltransferase
VADLSNTISFRTVLRYAGLAGSLLLALASYTVARGWVAIPLWLAGTVLLAGSWLVLGRLLSGVRLPWLLRTAALWASPLLASAPLASRDVYAYACQGALVAHGIDPYTHGAAALPCPWLSEMPVMWRSTSSPYGPLWLAVAGSAASTGHLAVAVGLLRAVALAGLVLLGWAGNRVATALGVDPVPAAWLALAGPLVLVHAVSGAHNDAVLAGLLMAALMVALTGPPGLVRMLAAGALVGLAVGVKATALVALPFLALLVARDRSWWAVIRSGLATVGGAVGAYGLCWAATGYGLGWVPALRDAPRLVIEWTSVPTGVGLALGRLLKLARLPGPASHAVGVVRAIALAVLVVLVVALWWWARRREDRREVVVATGLAMGASVVLAPITFPWYVIAALAVLGYSLVRDGFRWWVGAATTPLALLVLPSGSGLSAHYKTPGGILDVLIVVVAVIAGLTWAHRRVRIIDTRDTPGGSSGTP